MAVTPRLGLSLLDIASSGKEVVINGDWNILDSAIVRVTGDTMTGGLIISRTAVTSGTPAAAFTVNSPADTGLSIAEVNDGVWNFNANTRTFGSGGGTLANQRNLLINGLQTLAAGAALTVTNAATVHIVGAPVAGSNVTITNTAALWVQGQIVFGNNIQGTTKAGFTFAQVQSPSQPTAIWIQPNANTTPLTASSEAIDFNFQASRTVQWATGALATQRAFVLQAPTYSFVGASTLTDAATMAITGAPVAGTNATLTSSYALWIQGGGLRCQGHLALGGGNAPTAAAGSNAGTAPPAPVVTAGANDTRGNVTFGTGTTAAAGNMVAVSFNNLPQAYTSTPVVLVVPKNTATQALGLYVTSVTTGGFTLACTTAPASSQAATVFSFDFVALQ